MASPSGGSLARLLYQALQRGQLLAAERVQERAVRAGAALTATTSEGISYPVPVRNCSSFGRTSGSRGCASVRCRIQKEFLPRPLFRVFRQAAPRLQPVIPAEAHRQTTERITSAA